jgi:hypothetical protein
MCFSKDVRIHGHLCEDEKGSRGKSLGIAVLDDPAASVFKTEVSSALQMEDVGSGSRHESLVMLGWNHNQASYRTRKLQGVNYHNTR